MKKLTFEDCINLVGKKVWDNINKKYVFVESVYHSYNYIKGCNEVKITFKHDGMLYDINELELYKENPNILWTPKYDETYYQVYLGSCGWTFSVSRWADFDADEIAYKNGFVFKTEEEAKKCCEILNYIDECKLSKNEITDKVNNEDNIYKLTLNNNARVIGIEDAIYLNNTDYFYMQNAKKIMDKFSYQELVKYYFRLPVD